MRLVKSLHLLLLKKEQGYFPLFPSTKHPPLGCFLPPFSLFLASRLLIPSTGNTTCQTAQAPAYAHHFSGQKKKKKLLMGNASFSSAFVWLVALLGSFPKWYTAPNLLYCSTRYRRWVKRCALVPNTEYQCVIGECKCEQLHLSQEVWDLICL